MTVIHLKKKDIVKSSVKGVAVEFDHEKLASILGIPGNNGICEYVKDVWEESKYIKPLEITKRIPEAELLKFQAEFERKRANRFHADLEKAKAENARLLALLHQAKFKPNP
ncbi:hypothetical protein Dimus_031582 [Dionaea muscipula]